MFSSVCYYTYMETQHTKETKMKAFQFAKILEIAQLPANLKQAVIDEAYNNSTIEGMQIEAAVNLMEVPAAVRNQVYQIGVSTFEKLSVSVVGKFVFVYEFWNIESKEKPIMP